MCALGRFNEPVAPARRPRTGDAEVRRWIVRLSAIGAVDSALVSLRQVGVIHHLPDPPGEIFNSNAVTTSRPAYALGVPDAIIATAGYVLNIGLVRASRGRGRLARFAQVALLASAVVGATGAAAYLSNMLLVRRRLCPYCLAAIEINFTLVPLALRSGRQRLA